MKQKKINMHYGRTANRLMKYVAGTYKLQFCLACFAIVISALANTAGPLFLMFLIDDIIAPLLSMQVPNFGALGWAILVMAVIYYVGVLCTWIYNRLMINIGQGVQKKIRDEMFATMQKLPVKFFDTHVHGELMSIYTNDIDTLRQMISQSIPQALSSLVTVVAIFTIMILLSWQMAIFSVVFVAVMILVTKAFGKRSGRYFVAQQNNLAQTDGFIEEMMTGQKVIKVFNHEEEAKADFVKLNDKLCESMTKANTFANILMPCIGNIGNLQYVLMAMLGGSFLMFGVGALTIGKLVSYLQFTKSFNMPFSQISQQINSIVMALAGAGRIFALMDQSPETDDGYVTLVNVRSEDGTLVETAERTGLWAWKHPHHDGTLTYTRLRGEVVFSDMTFGYNEEKTILFNLSLTANPGEKIAFVGSTGAGKTTITNLINRFYDVQDGKIRYDGINVNKIKKADLRRSLGIVLQDTHLFTGTIMENIRYGRLNATDEEVYAAAGLANADFFIRMLPNGYETELTGEGEELSQGQRQLLAIARAAVADPPVLILDEATSSIDTRTELIVSKGMDGLMRGRTVFVIAHRLSTVRNADQIIVLDHGRIIEEGRHEELLALKGKYWQLNTGALELE